jgi:hypothetical protein
MPELTYPPVRDLGFGHRVEKVRVRDTNRRRQYSSRDANRVTTGNIYAEGKGCTLCRVREGYRVEEGRDSYRHSIP